MAKEDMDFMAMFGQTQDSELPSKVNFDEFTEVDGGNPFFDTETADEAVSGGAANVDNDAADSVHVMDIHSHNTMKASFSAIDDADEKATRIYAVIGRLDKYLPDITARISVGGKFVEIPPSSVFEYPFNHYPAEWRDVTDKIIVEANGGETK